MEGTHNEETEAIQEGNEEFKADQGYGETREENESGYQIYTRCHLVSHPGHTVNGHASYPQQGGACAHR